jgi:hypothetical protein
VSTHRWRTKRQDRAREAKSRKMSFGAEGSTIEREILGSAQDLGWLPFSDFGSRYLCCALATAARAPGFQLIGLFHRPGLDRPPTDMGDLRV